VGSVGACAQGSAGSSRGELGHHERLATFVPRQLVCSSVSCPQGSRRSATTASCSNSGTSLEAAPWLITLCNGGVFTLLAMLTAPPPRPLSHGARHAAARCPSGDSCRPRRSSTRASLMPGMSHFLRCFLKPCRGRDPLRGSPGSGSVVVVPLTARRSRLRTFCLPSAIEESAFSLLIIARGGRPRKGKQVYRSCCGDSFQFARRVRRARLLRPEGAWRDRPSDPAGRRQSLVPGTAAARGRGRADEVVQSVRRSSPSPPLPIAGRRIIV
jgi:hypothetical protein